MDIRYLALNMYTLYTRIFNSYMYMKQKLIENYNYVLAI